MGTERASFRRMQAMYEQYRVDSAPCKSPSITNQCAIRMSLALVRNGLSLGGFRDQRRIHTGRDRCQLGTEPHIVGADELHRYLVMLWGNGKRGSGASFRSEIAGEKGVLYFNNCFHRGSDPDGENRGDHIDLWDGTNYYNELLHVSAGGSARPGTNLFRAASYVRFFALLD